ncbi:MAG: RagB/SusD family nutrient uptake outer membrane protein [Muribaculaceae bacterium]|nr:RagB/SusD family nutrient uptake outer membrane protein [Muribaculaceae bacterium]
MKTLKNIIKSALCISAVAAMGMGATSCSDMLDTTPQGVISENEVGPEQAEQLLTAAYATLICHYFGNNESFAGPINNWVFDVRSDDALKGGETLGMEGYINQLEMGIVMSDNPVGAFKWRNNYFSISRCNTAIRAIKASPTIQGDLKESMVAEMKTLRAYYYFDMYRIFEKFPYFDETVEDPSSVSANEYTKDQIVEFIKQDLRDAYDVLPETQEQVARFNKYVAAAILAKVDLFTSSWEEAAKYSQYVIASGKYGLFPNFLDISKPEFNNQQESVFAVQFSSANSPDQFNFSNTLNCTVSEGNLYGNGDDFYLGSQNLVDAFRTDVSGLPYLDGGDSDDHILSAEYAGNIDPRLDFTLGRIGMPWRSYPYNENWCRALNLYGQYSGKKPYPSPDNPEVTVGIVPWGASSLNYMIIRYADVLLMRAEALIEMGENLEEARQLINQVRSRAAKSIDPAYEPVDIDPTIAHYAITEYPATGWSQDYARKALRMERRLELAMEGHRWFDLVRWGEAVNVMTNYYQSEVQFHDYYKGASLKSSDLYLPVPLEQAQNAGDLYN